jgi:L-idonate 5-dehydrogenase
MLAAVCYGKKDLRVESRPVLPLAPDEVRVSVAFGGICGSDLHYYHRGGVGDFSIREPMALGHEISGRVLEVGSAVTGIAVGCKAALNPSKACLQCAYCREGRSNLCTNMYFLGSAGRFPHVQGGFAEQLILRQDQIIPVPAQTDLLTLSLAEPLSVGLHAVKRAGSLLGKKVIVTGSGPIGLLTAKSALFAGAAEVVVTDIHDQPLQVARDKIGVHKTINVATEAAALLAYTQQGGYFDVALEASGSAEALLSLFSCVRRGGRIVQLGMLPPGTAPIPVNLLQTREIELLGSFRAHDEFALAVELIVTGAMEITAILSGTFPLHEATAALEQAGDRSRFVKLHLALGADA